MSAGSRRRTDAFTSAAGAALIVAAVSVIYRAAIISYLFNDDFNWFDEAGRFAFANLFHFDRYNHFYRPVVEIYFYLGPSCAISLSRCCWLRRSRSPIS